MEEVKKAFDLSALDTSGDQVFEFAVLHPTTNEPLDFVIGVVGSDSNEYQESQRVIARRQQNKLKRARRDAADPAEVDAAVTELLATATRRWKGSVVLDGAALPAFSVEAAQRLYSRLRWLREQVAAAIGERENFLVKPAKP